MREKQSLYYQAVLFLYNIGANLSAAKLCLAGDPLRRKNSSLVSISSLEHAVTRDKVLRMTPEEILYLSIFKY
ncbi:hypothetical protein OUZ56_014376 [Daphnia magna]|uniref:Uncharacterized protein n=1 Tax=Daphnia magna TaxID=35525 RepID=A0ABR0AJK0_9CRUS|nr:hypothetical protein OUZ56_014376 [Daphnia magna]